MLSLAQRTSVSAGNTLLIDARPASSYHDGHIPTSLLLDFPSSLLKDSDNFTHLRDPEALKKHIAEQLGQNILDEIVLSKVTVVNSKPTLLGILSPFKARQIIMVTSMWRRSVCSNKLVISSITRSELSTL